MRPSRFPEANSADGRRYSDSLTEVIAFDFIAADIAALKQSGRLWLRRISADGSLSLSPHSPFQQARPLAVKEEFAGLVIVHMEEGEELLFIKVRPGMVLNPSVMFDDDTKVKLVGYGPDVPHLWPLLKMYSLDPAWTYIAKRL